MIAVQPTDFLYIGPLLVLTVMGLLVVLGEAFAQGAHRRFLMQMTVFASVMTIVATVVTWRALGPGESVSAFSGMLVADRMGMFFIGLFAGTTGLIAMLTAAHQREFDWEIGEVYGLMLLATAGMAMIAMAGDLVVVFIGIETMSLAVYVMTAAQRRHRGGSEGAMKYFLMGAFASGFLVYGMALLYGATGSTNLATIQTVLSNEVSGVAVIGIFLLIVAFGFKVAAVPFHMWTPDAYQGAPTPVTGYMAGAVKAAAFVGVVRVFVGGLGGAVLPFGRIGWATIFAVLAAITMTVGNIAAIRQDNIKRMLAYSSIAHAGVLLVGIVTAGVEPGGQGLASVLFYLLSYSVATIGAFGVITWVGASEKGERVHLSDWHGLGASHPGAALVMTLFMLSFAGIPPLAGFVGKFMIFKSAVLAYDQQLLWLVVIGVMNSMVSIYYYLRVVMAMYFRDANGEFAPVRSSGAAFVLVICAILALQMGILPSQWLGYLGV